MLSKNPNEVTYLQKSNDEEQVPLVSAAEETDEEDEQLETIPRASSQASF